MSIDTPVLTAERVHEIFMDCLFRDGEDHTHHVVAEGIVMTVAFHPDRLESHRDEIAALLAELPDDFRIGQSFLQACMDRHGNQWTGMQPTMDQLLQLGLATGQVDYCLPREMWHITPGGMPYILVK